MDSVFLRDLAIVIAVAAATTLLCRALRQPVVIGYLLAGLIIGPHTPPFTLVHDLNSIHTMAELGLVILMFVLGLEFNLPKLRKVGVRAALATLFKIFGMLALGYAAGRWLGWDRNNSIYLGAILSISSTTIVVKVLHDMKLSRDDFAQTVFGILILEDIAAVVILTVLSGLGVRHETESLTVLRALTDVSFFVALFLIFGLGIVPRLLRWVGQFKSNEMLGLVALGLCLFSALAAKHFGFSVALGAFLMGAVIAASSEVEHIENWIHPIRDLFSAMFFISAGLLIDPQLLWSIKRPVLLITTITLAGKMLTGAVGSFLAGYPLKTSFRVGMTLTQIGEFSFVFAFLGMRTGLAADFLYPLSVAVSALTTLFTPYLIRYSDTALEGFMRIVPRSVAGPIERYEEYRERQQNRTEGIDVLSRYIWRLGICVVLLTAGFLLTRSVDNLISQDGAAPWVSMMVWAASWILQLPLVHAVAGYINHFLLLTLTEFTIRSRFSAFFQKVPIQRTYDISEGMIWTSLAVLWAMQPDLRGGGAVLASLAVMGLAALGLRRVLHIAYGKLEAFLDEIFGLASSEPLRRAAISVEGPGSLLNESIQRIVLKKGSPASHQSLRELRLREQTGASVIAIYRHGELTANPTPETVLHPSDVLVVLGDKDDCRKAEHFLAPAHD
jgi:CPA2 family monovalent cation:H+ antiporter-2